MNSKITIRFANPGDAELIARLHATSWKSAYQGILSRDYLEDEVDNERKIHWVNTFNNPKGKNDFVLIAIEDEVAVGFIAVYDLIDGVYDAYIDNLHVLPEKKGSGIGLFLMSTAAKELLKLNKQSAYLWVYDDNVAAVRFYEKIEGQSADKGIDVTRGKQISKTRFYWPDLQKLADAFSPRAQDS